MVSLKLGPSFFKLSTVSMLASLSSLDKLSNCLIELLPTIRDRKYRELVINQLTFLNTNKHKLANKVEIFYQKYESNRLTPSQKNRCCDFKLLEEKCNEYIEKEVLYT